MPSPSSAGSMGPVSKALAVARVLRAHGCQVRFVLGGDLAQLVMRSGFEVFPYPVPRPADSLQPVRNVVDFLAWGGMTDPAFVEAGVEAELCAIRDFGPDVIYAEARPTAAISACAMGIPLVTIISWPTHPDFPANHESNGQCIDIFNRQLRRYHLPEIAHVAELLSLRGNVKLAPTLPELEPELQALPDVQFVGYMLDLDEEHPWLPEWYPHWPDKPLIFIYLSVSAIPPDVYTQIIPAAFEGLPFDVLCACGFHYEMKSLPPPTANVRFERYVPLRAIIDHTCIIIFHGGQNTMMTALFHGLPSLILPGQHFERGYNAMQLCKLGASRVLPVHAFRPQRLRAAVMEVLEGSYAAESRKLAHALRQYGGAEQAGEIVLSAAQQPVG